MGVHIVHEQFVRLATRLIRANGRKIELLSFEHSPEEYDSVNEKITTKEVIGLQTSFTTKEMQDSRVEARDLMFLIDSATVGDVDIEMKLKDGEIVYSIIDVSELKPADNSILFRVHVRK